MTESMNRPSFFIVGHSKSGTTALAKFLDQHPALFLSKDPKEPNYFCPSWSRADGPPSHFVKRTEAEYLALFDEAEPGQQCGEASAVYLYAPESAEAIHAFDPEARIIMLFREPVSFIRSYHLQMLKNPVSEGETVKDLSEAIRLEPARKRGEELPEGCLLPELLYYTTDRLRYDEHYDRYAAIFPHEQILALTYDDFRRDNLGTVRRVFAFLGVDTSVAPEFGEYNTGGVTVRSKQAQTWLRRLTHGEGLLAPLKAIAKVLLPKSMRQQATKAAYDNLAFAPAEAVAPEVAEQIRAAARPHVEALSTRLGRDLMAEWGYEREPVAEEANG